MGVFGYKLALFVFATFMKVFFDSEMLESYDMVMLLDKPENLSNFVGVLFFEEFEFESMKEHMLGKTHLMHKCRSKLVMNLGIWFFKKMDEAEWDLKKDAVVVKKGDIHTE